MNQVTLMLGLFFDPEDGDCMFLRNLGWFSADYTALCPPKIELFVKSWFLVANSFVKNNLSSGDVI
jgi:hypothetical protein